jgi:tRNA 2-thiouridine synthesizing protein A
MANQADDESHPLRELRRLAGGRCRTCARAYTAREAVASIVLGFKDAPRCLPCLAHGLSRELDALRVDLLDHVPRRECYARAWTLAEELDGPAPEWLPMPEPGEAEKIESSRFPPVDPDPVPPASWDAGDISCGELVLALRGKMNALPPGAVLKVTATDPAAPEDLPAWCRLTGNPLVRMNHPDYYIRRKEN